MRSGETNPAATRPVATGTTPSAPPAPDVANDAHVSITADRFEPSRLQIPRGTTVVWTNVDRALHQIASNPHPAHTDVKGLQSAILNPTQTYEHRFRTAGTFGYHDEQNLTVNGSVDVR